MIFRYAQNQNTQSTVVATIGASEYHIGQIGGTTSIVGNSFDRPANATPYIANDIVSSNSALVIKPCARIVNGTGYITSFKLVTNAVITPRIRIHIGKTSTFFTTLTDNAANNQTFSDLSGDNYIGYVDMPVLASGGNTTTSIVNDNTQRVPYETSTSNIELFFVLETLDPFTPISGQTFQLTIATEQN